MISWSLKPRSSVRLRGSPLFGTGHGDAIFHIFQTRSLILAIEWTTTQQARLIELGASNKEQKRTFDTDLERNSVFQELEKTLTRTMKQQLAALRDGQRRPQLCLLESKLTETLVQKGFVQVTTPIILSRSLLDKMSVTEDHSLNSQVYWLEKNKCLRPMLAPNLYYLVRDLLRLWEKPVRIFEIGPCFRKESEGRLHASEFTMLNLCEFGLPMEQRQERLEELATLIMVAAEIEEYKFVTESSAVYGSTFDIVTSQGEELELGSGAMGPHPLDQAWKIMETWVGIGFGLERLVMANRKSGNLGRHARSLSYLDGIRLAL